MLLVTMAGHTVLETARDSLFLSRMAVAQLPFTYISIAVAALIASELHGRLQLRGKLRAQLALTLIVGAVGALGFCYLFGVHASWAPHALYVWIAVTASLFVAQFWLLLSEWFTVSDAKRLYPMISAGGLVGAMSGGALARAASARYGDVALLGIGAGLFVLAAGVTGAGGCPKRPDAATPLPNVAPSDAAGPVSRRDLRTQRYLRRLLMLTLLASISGTLLDYLFKAEVARSVPSAELGSFFGSMNVWLNGAALVTQLILAPRLLGGLGVGRALQILPALLLVVLLGASWLPGMLFVLALRGGDGTLRNSLHRNTVELLYLPLSTGARARWKTLVDALGQRGGQALGSLAILACLAIALPTPAMLVLLGVSLLGWLYLAATMERHYLALFRAKIKAGAIETRAEVPALDLLALESLVAALGSDDDDEVLTTIDLLVDYDRAHVIPALLLYHPSRRVVIRTLDVLAKAGRSDFTGAARRLLTRDAGADDEVRAAAMLALARHMLPSELRAELTTELPVAARAAVLSALLARGLDATGAYAAETARACEPEAAGAVRLAFARAFNLQAHPFCRAYLPRLLVAATPELELEVARIMRVLPDVAHVPYLLQMLDSRKARAVARDALVAVGPPALQALAAALADPDLPRALRAHLPRSISRFDTPEAADYLLDQLEHESDGWVRFKMIRGLGQLRSHFSQPARRRRALAQARQNLIRATHFLAWRIASERDRVDDPRLVTPGGDLLIAALRDKQAHAIDRAVRLVGLSHSPHMIHDIRRALAGNDARRRAESLEVLVHAAPPDITRALLALLDDRGDELRLARAAEALHERIPTSDYQARLEIMLADESEAVRSVAAYHVGELGIEQLAEPFKRAEGRSSALSRDVFARVSRVLADGLPPPVPVGVRARS
jgi:AAA family ATP:ADP antiporter